MSCLLFDSYVYPIIFVLIDFELLLFFIYVFNDRFFCIYNFCHFCNDNLKFFLLRVEMRYLIRVSGEIRGKMKQIHDYLFLFVFRILECFARFDSSFRFSCCNLVAFYQKVPALCSSLNWVIWMFLPFWKVWNLLFYLKGCYELNRVFGCMVSLQRFLNKIEQE